MQTNDLMKVTRMTVYSGEYKKARKNGVTNWAKVAMHVSPVATDPLDGTKYVNHAIDCVVAYWISDMAVAELLGVAQAKGQKFTKDDNHSSGYILEEKDIPRQYRYAFTDMGMTLHWERINFETTRFKVAIDENDNRRYKIVKSNGKPVMADSITVTYWTGGLADNTGVNLSREYCMKRALEEWREIALPTIDRENKGADDAKNKGAESTGA